MPKRLMPIPAIWIVVLAFFNLSWAQCPCYLEYTFTGQAAGYQFGKSVSGAGDVNNDGYDDLIVGAPSVADSGRAHVYSGETGGLLWAFTGEAADDLFGWSVSGAGDVNNDGYDDLIVGAPEHDGPAGSNSGRVYVFSGLDADTLYVLTQLEAGAQFGFSVSGAGDVNNDGYDDFIVGLPFQGSADAGRAYIFSGLTGGVVWSHSGEEAGDHLGFSVSGAGDVNNDGYDDYVIGAPEYGFSQGQAYVHSGMDGSRLWTFTGTSNLELGYSVSGAGDVNSDDYDDVIVGAPGGGAGWARVYSGQTGGLLWIFTGEAGGERFGKSVSGAGDVNNDGYDDLIVGAPYNNAGGADAGRAYIYSGQTSDLLGTLTGEAAGDYFGWWVSGAGKVDRDGHDDVIVGAYGNDAGGSEAGRAYVYSWRCPDDPNDLGTCDTIHVETFDCDHFYNAEPGSFDSVRIAIYVTHDSNTFWDGSQWVQDSISGFVVPLIFWHEPSGCADSVIFPNWDDWNNIHINPGLPEINRSLFRHIVDSHTGDTVYNRMLEMVENGKEAWMVSTDIESHSSDGDSGHVFFSVTPVSENCQYWWEGKRELLATLTFHVYMSEDCDTTEIGLDTAFWLPSSYLAFSRLDAVPYIPRHLLPVKDTVFLGRPAVSDIPDQTILRDESFASINLDDHVTDPDDHDSVMIWSHWGEVELAVDITDRVVTITVPDLEWFGSETIWFKTCDPGGLCDSNEATFTVRTVPVVSDIPDQIILQGESFASINLDDYVTDPDDHDSVMIWSHWGEVELLVDITDRVVTITVPNSEWFGSEIIWFKACDPGGLCDSNEATFTVIPTGADVIAGEDQTGATREEVSVMFYIQNIGPVTVTYDLDIVSSLGWDIEPQHLELTLDSAEIDSVSVTVSIPNVPLGTSDRVTLEAIPQSNPYGADSDSLTVTCDYYGIKILQITDIPNDQGKQVRIKWLSFTDLDSSVTHFTIFRRIDSLLFAPSRVNSVIFPSKDYPPGDWEIVGTYPAYGETLYATTVPTLRDSTISEGMYYSLFFTRAGTDNPYVYYDSPIDSGYSLDNLSPSPPTALLASHEPAVTKLTWTKSIDVDFDYYTLYRDTTSEFEPSPDNRLAFTIDTAFVDSTAELGRPCYYLASATDFSGNESDPSKEAMGVRYITGDANTDGTTDVGDIVFLVNYLFFGAYGPDPLEAGDADCNGEVDVGDIIYLVNYVLLGGMPPPC